MRKSLGTTKKPDKDPIPLLLVGRGLRPTRQRLALASYLFDGFHKHVTAEQVMEMLKKRRARISLATVYNTLHQFTGAGLLREISINQRCSYFDTNIDAHHHYFDEVTGRLMDIPADDIKVSSVPVPPTGRKVKRIDVTVHLSKAR